MAAGHVVYGTVLLLVLNRLQQGDRSRYPHHDWVMTT